MSIALGALLGSQRESIIKRSKVINYAGFRSFIFLALMGYLLGYLSKNIFDSFIILYIGFFGVFSLAITTYIISYSNKRKIESITGEVALLITFLIGLLISLGYYYFSITLSIIITTILFFTDAIHKFVGDLNDKEIFATLKFAIIAFVILPLLPNKDYTLFDFPIISDIMKSQSLISHDIIMQLNVFNFYNIWLMVVFVSAIGYAGYILMRTIGARKGIIMTGFLAGFMSSTAVTSSFALRSKKMKILVSPLVIGTIIACSTMFIRILFEVLIIYPGVFGEIFLLFTIMGIVGYITAIYFYRKEKKKHNEKVHVSSPFTLGPALKFGFLFMFVLLISKLFTLLFGSSGIYLVSFFSGVADVDAITISLLNLARDSQISDSTAVIGIVLASLSNTLFKGGLAYYLGSKEFGIKIVLSFLIILIVGVLLSLMFF